MKMICKVCGKVGEGYRRTKQICDWKCHLKLARDRARARALKNKKQNDEKK